MRRAVPMNPKRPRRYTFQEKNITHGRPKGAHRAPTDHQTTRETSQTISCEPGCPRVAAERRQNSNGHHKSYRCDIGAAVCNGFDRRSLNHADRCHQTHPGSICFGRALRHTPGARCACPSPPALITRLNKRASVTTRNGDVQASVTMLCLGVEMPGRRNGRMKIVGLI